ncbi:YoaK family protein [Microbacterium sp.]|uniref:YoaK family protein n=1 Tax=Microbacterium sp. TaxID=51671 RepID=UPI0025F21346|nr:YoaK family protein [Microbacterium sp.]
MVGRRHLVHGERLHLVLLLSLTFSTGIVDAVGYLGLDRVFAGNMTGNIVILGMGLAGADGLPVIGPLLALVTFVLGASAAGLAMRGVRAGWTARATVMLAAAAVLIAAAMIPRLVSGPSALPGALTATALLAAAMGVQAGVARHIAVAEVTTVVVTSALVALAFELFSGNGMPQRWVRRVVVLALLVLGAFTGAVLLSLSIFLALGAAATITAAVAVLGAVSRDAPQASGACG